MEFNGFTPFITSSVFGTILGFVATQLYNYWVEVRRVRISCHVLLIEVNKHLCWMQGLKTGDKYTLNLLYNSTDTEWKKLKYELLRMNFKDFEIVCNHYESMNAVRAWAEACLRNEANITIPPHLLNPVVAKTELAYKTLWKCKSPLYLTTGRYRPDKKLHDSA